MSRFFVDRPIFATVLSVVIIIIGVVALAKLPIAQYPDVVPPTIQVTATYPGANASTVANTVATPIEVQVNGVERMIYMSSQCTNDGQMNLSVTFEVGTDLNMAQVLVQNRVAMAIPNLPQEVQRIGVTTKKKSPSILLCVNLVSTDSNYDQTYLSNFATLNIKDDLARIKGVGDVVFLGPRDYSMRVWLDPNKLGARNLTAGDVVNAIKEQNVQVAAGRLGQPPVTGNVPIQFDVPLNTQGRLTNEDAFGKIIVKTSDKGGVVYLRDLVREPTYDQSGKSLTKGIELGARNYDVNSFLGDKDSRVPSTTLAVFQLPGSNALSAAEEIRGKMEQLKGRFPPGIEYKIVYDTTVFVEESIHEVYKTLIEAFVLVFIVVIVFLQDWRATVLPVVDVVVSLIGTFALMALLGFSLNNLTLFGLVLAVGIVVDDAIVVVENIERWMGKGLPAREAILSAMDEITGPVIGITAVLCAVFIPTVFMAGISGRFYSQFALTIACSTVISAINSLTMSPARASTLIKPHTPGSHAKREALPPLGIALIFGAIVYAYLTPLVAPLVGIHLPAHGHEAATHESSLAMIWALRAGVFLAGCIVGWLLSPVVNQLLLWFFGCFNWAFDWITAGYAAVLRRVVRLAVVMLVLYFGLNGLTVFLQNQVPPGFIPDQDKGYLVLNAALPDGARLTRTDRLMEQISKLVRDTPGVAYTIEVPGYSILLSTNLSNVGGMFIVLEPFEKRAGVPALGARAIGAAIRKRLAAAAENPPPLGSENPLRQGVVNVFGAPPVDGLGSTGGFKMQVQDQRNAGFRTLQGSVRYLAEQGNNDPRLVGLFSSFTVNQPQMFVEIDKEKAKTQGVPLADINLALQAYLGSYYVNDFEFQNRNWQVNIQADPAQRMQIDDIGNLEVRNSKGAAVPLRTLINVRYDSGPAIVNHYNLYPSAEINGGSAPGVSSGQAIKIMDGLAKEYLPSEMGFEWTDLAFQEVLAGKDLLSKFVFPLSVLFVFLVLAAMYESWSLPIAIILIVPMCLLAAIAGVWLAGLDNNIFTQIGLVVLVALAAKNAILVVEYAKQLQDQGRDRSSAAVEAAAVRLRPILMTSFAFILGVVPLVLAKGAGAEMRVSLGVAVFSGMLGVTIFGVFFTPVFYVVIRWFAERKANPAAASNVSSQATTAKNGDHTPTVS